MKTKSHRYGLTLVELLVAITILTVVTALIIPRLRIVNKDRNIREAARVVGSAFASARQRALIDGASGVVIVRNPNFVSTTTDGNSVFYAGTRLFELRAIPPYIGEVLNATCTTRVMSDQIQVLIPAPSDPSFVQINDFIRIGGGQSRYRIVDMLPLEGLPPNELLPLVLEWDNDNVGANSLDLTQPDFITGLAAPPIAMGLGLPFSIERQPVRVQSSVVDLPPGYIVDLRFSGPIDDTDADGDPETWTLFGLGIADPAQIALPANSEIVILFDGSGSLDRVIFNGNNVLIGQSLFLYVNEFDPSIQIELGNDALATAVTLLSVSESLWMTVGVNGGAAVSYNAPPPPSNGPMMISAARTISVTRTSASQ